MSRTAWESEESGLVVESEDAKVLSWRNDHLATRKELELMHVQKKASAAAQEIDQFVGDHLKSADSCHAKILEARRTLDGITAQVLAMDDNMEHQRNIEVESTIALRVAVEDRKSAEAELAKSQETCHGMEDDSISKYEDELEELRQIAMPSVQSMISRSEDYGDTATAVAADIKGQISDSDALKAQVAADLNGPSSSLAEISWGPDQCRRFLSFLSKMSGVTKATGQLRAPTGGQQAAQREFLELDCSEARFLLQHEFSSAYLELYGLHEAATVRLDEEQKACLRRAHNVYERKVKTLDDEIRKHTARIAKARAVVNGLMPRLQDASRASTKMEQHLKRLKNECEVSGEVSEHLLKVRKLIESLEACPGRNAFRLTIPTV